MLLQPAETKLASGASSRFVDIDRLVILGTQRAALILPWKNCFAAAQAGVVYVLTRKSRASRVVKNRGL